MRTARLAVILLALAGCDGLQVNPSSVRFAGGRYQVEVLNTANYGFTLTRGDEVVRLDGRPLDARHILPCPPPALLAHDFNGDDDSDIGFYSCGWIDLYIDSGKPLDSTEPVTIEYRDARWGFHRWQYPGLVDLDRDLMRRLDPDA